MKEVDFKKYCPACKYLKKRQDQKPCAECLETPAREDTARPVNFEKP